MTSVSKGTQETADKGLVPFRLSVPEYDQSTYMGRFKHLLKVQNPYYTFLTSKQIKKAQIIIAEQEALERTLDKKSMMYISSEKAKLLRRSQYEVASSVHPDTKEILAPYQRFSSYSVMNIPILFGMILMKQTPATIVFWQWINQTYNAIMNYANRNASSSLDMKGLGISYSAAVVSSISIGLGMRKLLTPFTRTVTGPGLLFYNFIISVTAVGCASVLNVLIMRSKEMQEGIMLVDHEGREYGKSQIIGKDAVLKTAASRIILPIPPLLFPTVAFYYMEKKKLVPKKRLTKLLTESFIFFGSMAFAPPL